AARDLEEPLGVELADITGPEPVVVERLCREVFTMVVTTHDADAFDQDFAVVGNLYRVTRKRPADRADLDERGCVHGDGSCGLREAVALKDLEADALEEMPEPLAERSAARA